jgi:hypothetical protein
MKSMGVAMPVRFCGEQIACSMVLAEGVAQAFQLTEGLDMASKKECDQFATELNDRFEAFMKWAMANWPKKESPLMSSDFAESRKEIAQIVGPKLGEGSPDPAAAGNDDPAPFVDVTPMPWP